jgi:dTDP-4-dehydrorhamnose 3,5-epimerase
VKFAPLALPEILLIEPDLFGDARGHLIEAWQAARYQAAGIDAAFVQDNLTRSEEGVVRGLHFQMPEPQGKLVMCAEGEIFDVAVDVRRGAPRFGRWAGARLSAANGHQLWIPAGFAHGFCVLGGPAVCLYKCTAPYAPGGQMAVRWNDPDIGIDWPVAAPLLSPKDAAAPLLRDIPPERLPRWTGG